ncbi:Oligopeptide transport ATP-binding protein OppF (TC 3.A.1.5.1) [hydrothermal vent metagenome]|uniref:Oligopeptide transport ATP-binding protein OppF (TC 3.A.1.5.1) n=1 Tax=hydrothermal vent metagenome TaxID=652676 RepID=A0A3B0U7I8_9ZZZZ
MSVSSPLLHVEGLKVHFAIKPDGAMPWTKPLTLRAVDGVSFDIKEGETLGIVGESGCGKSTLARAVISLVPVKDGKIVWLGTDLAGASKAQMRPHRKEIQMIFQDPLASLDPRMNIGEIIAEPLKTHFPKTPKAKVRKKVKDMMARVGLLPNLVNRYPHEFSGGQCQRIGIARALILEPKLIICDEPVSALDVSIQAQVVNLLRELQQELGLALIFIAHDLSVVKHISDRIMVLYLGNAVEIAPSEELYEHPRHPYTGLLIDAVPIPDPEIELNREVKLIEGELPSPLNPPSGCVFRTRCPKAQQRCAAEKPILETVGAEHQVSCFFPN